MVAIISFLIILIVVGVSSGKLVDGPITPPAILTAGGVVIAAVVGNSAMPDEATILTLTEITLSLVLFADASRIAPMALRMRSGVPIRLLAIALPLAVMILTGVAMVVLDLGLGSALLVASALAATDAALARLVIESDQLPAVLRRSINIESGLNDGLATPVVTIAIAMIAGQMAGGAAIIEHVLAPLGLAVVIGVTAGTVGGRLLHLGRSRGAVDPTFAQVTTFAVISMAIAVSIATNAIVFVAAFVAGLAFRNACGDAAPQEAAFTEDMARLMTMAAFFLFGLVLVPTGLVEVGVADVVVVVVALTVARMVAVALSLVGSGLAWPTTAMIGWFGPRGLATVVFLFLAREELGEELPAGVVSVLVLAVVASIVLHGATARPLGNRYARWLEAHGGRDRGDVLSELSEEHLDVGRARR